MSLLLHMSVYLSIYNVISSLVASVHGWRIPLCVLSRAMRRRREYGRRYYNS